MKTIISALAIATALFAGSGVAQADFQDSSWDQYIAALDGSGTVTDEKDAVLMGLAVCVDLLTGSSESSEAEAMMTGGFTEQEAEAVIDAARTYLCPDGSAHTMTPPVTGGVGGQVR